MIRIVTDTSTLYTKKEAEKFGVEVLPLVVTVAGKQYRELEEIDPKTFNDLVKQGNVPTSSQPAIGETMEIFEKYKDDEILVINMADGLSGTYQSTVGVKETMENNENITVINTRTLCGPHRYLLQLAVKLRDEGKSVAEIVKTLNEKMEYNVSFLMPQDFDFLRRGGRISGAAATLGGLLKIQPVVTTPYEGNRLDKFTTGRNFELAVKAIIKDLKEVKKIDTNHKLFVSHGFAEEQAKGVVAKLEAAFPGIEVELLTLSCAFITQGGPGCVAIQSILK